MGFLSVLSKCATPRQVIFSDKNSSNIFARRYLQSQNVFAWTRGHDRRQAGVAIATTNQYTNGSNNNNTNWTATSIFAPLLMCAAAFAGYQQTATTTNAEATQQQEETSQPNEMYREHSKRDTDLDAEESPTGWSEMNRKNRQRQKFDREERTRHLEHKAKQKGETHTPTKTSNIYKSGEVHGDSPDAPSRPRLRRANTRLTTTDTIMQDYEYRLRENASLQKVFKYFTTIVLNGREYMTPLDMVRAITPGVPPSDGRKPINMPLHDAHDLAELGHFSEIEVPDFFRLGEGDSGLISFGRFLIFVTLAAIPANELNTAYLMSCGPDFATQQMRSDRLNIHNFDFIMKRSVKVRGYGYSPQHSRRSAVRYLFGKDLSETLSFDEFKEFHSELCNEILSLEYVLLSDHEDENGQPAMSLPAFARSVAALVPSGYRPKILARAAVLADTAVPWNIEAREVRLERKKSIKDLGLKADALIPERTPQEDRAEEDRKCHEECGNVSRTASKIGVSFEEYRNWKEVLKQLSDMEDAVKRYAYADGHFTQTNLKRSAKAVAKVKLPKKMVWTLFQLFDEEGEGELHHDNFVRLLKPHMSATNPTIEPEGLGLGMWFQCIRKSVRECNRGWYEGTMDDDMCKEKKTQYFAPLPDLPVEVAGEE